MEKVEKTEPYAALGSPSISGSGQTEDDERSDNEAKRHLFSDAETNTVSSSGLYQSKKLFFIFYPLHFED